MYCINVFQSQHSFFLSSEKGLGLGHKYCNLVCITYFHFTIKVIIIITCKKLIDLLKMVMPKNFFYMLDFLRLKRLVQIALIFF